MDEEVNEVNELEDKLRDVGLENEEPMNAGAEENGPNPTPPPSSPNGFEVKVHPRTERQNSLYKELAATGDWKANYKKLKATPSDSPRKEGHVRFVCISDTHNKHEKVDLPEGDILLHAGDFTWKGSLQEVEAFCVFLRGIKQKYKHIVLIAGNHELSFDDKKGVFFGLFRKKADTGRGALLKEMLKKHCIYLEDEEINLMGFKIYGTPWQPYHRGWAFNLPRGEPLLEKWNKIPSDTDILLCHGPPLGHGDATFVGLHVGCTELLSTIQQRVKPKLNVFGHIHEGHGITTDGTTVFINAAICNFRFQPIQQPIIFDLPIPNGFEVSETN